LQPRPRPRRHPHRRSVVSNWRVMGR
jgi:hypothetical protein